MIGPALHRCTWAVYDNATGALVACNDIKNAGTNIAVSWSRHRRARGSLTWLARRGALVLGCSGASLGAEVVHLPPLDVFRSNMARLLKKVST